MHPRFVQIENGAVVNVSIGDKGQDTPSGWVEDDAANIGWIVDNGVLIEPQAQANGETQE